MHPIRDWKPDEFGGQEGEVRWDLFDMDLGVRLEEGGAPAYAQACADYLNGMRKAMIDALCEASIRYCNAMLDAIGETPREFAEVRDVLELIYPSSLIAPPAPADAEPLIHLELNCDWEEEHGMEWIVRDHLVQYVGGFFGENPFRDFEPRDAWNYG